MLQDHLVDPIERESLFFRDDPNETDADRYFTRLRANQIMVDRERLVIGMRLHHLFPLH